MKTWSTELERRLLLAIIAVSPSQAPPKWEDVINVMGGGLTTEAARQKFTQLKKSAQSMSDNAAQSPSAPSQATPRKRRKEADDVEQKSPSAKRSKVEVKQENTQDLEV